MKHSWAWVLFCAGMILLFYAVHGSAFIYVPGALGLLVVAKLLLVATPDTQIRFDLLSEHGLGYVNGEEPYRFTRQVMILPWLIHAELQFSGHRRQWRTFWKDSYKEHDWRRLRRIALNAKHVNTHVSIHVNRKNKTLSQ